jgi:hypothetical protein
LPAENAADGTASAVIDTAQMISFFIWNPSHLLGV